MHIAGVPAGLLLYSRIVEQPLNDYFTTNDLNICIVTRKKCSLYTEHIMSSYAVVILYNLGLIISWVVVDMSRDGHVYTHVILHHYYLFLKTKIFSLIPAETKCTSLSYSVRELRFPLTFKMAAQKKRANCIPPEKVVLMKNDNFNRNNESLRCVTVLYGAT